ncbi:putative bifunctional methylthioribulose-1-phosphate dehydratase/enolase-phosphatase E1 [Camellia lanceoleosa]|uniref:Bifunctional methylthioribulose-1-phosphate dehydratase/enolase-phosphatase E1 n=1 Tax=Camellia lanceoleosa TaxID=1840588 RepID=A0ACC0G1W7_9ERIC|nr:putative bifunctional methylthioribulose-1-phosphate dehydratase/enolase-phosphatase E1 [Camellia lanceoleosa]
MNEVPSARSVSAKPSMPKAYDMRNAGAVIHSHGMESCLVTMINPLAKEFRITHMEMIKGIQGHGYYDELVVPIIENTAHERELTDSLAEAVSIPSQQRYVGYWENTLSIPRGVDHGPPSVNSPEPCSRELVRIRLYGTVNTGSVFFVVSELQEISAFHTFEKVNDILN